MALNIEHAGDDRLARELGAETGECITTAVTVAVRERLEACATPCRASDAARSLRSSTTWVSQLSTGP